MAKPKIRNLKQKDIMEVAPITMRLIFKPEDVQAKIQFIEQVYPDITDILSEAISIAAGAVNLNVHVEDSGADWISYKVSL